MKKLEITQMENLQGSISCTGGIGFTVGLIAAGFILTAATAGAGVALVFAGYGAGFGAISNCKDNNWN